MRVITAIVINGIPETGGLTVGLAVEEDTDTEVSTFWING